jgi:APA family basic amino acid/polyamine antiporter
MTQPPEPHDSVTPHLSVWDAVSIIVGIVVGTSIFKVPKLVFENVDGPWQGLGCWVLGGGLALVGSLCYAELAATYPRTGGDYVYLTRAFGRWVGFLFGWAQLAVILTGSIGAMAYAFGDYAVVLWNNMRPESQALTPADAVWFAMASVVVLTALNLIGVVFGKLAQNVLACVKVVGLLGIVAAAWKWGGTASLAPVQSSSGASFGLAMVFVLYAYGGWNDAAYVAAEVRNPSRNLPRALIYGTLGITVIYVLVNAAYLWVLGFAGARESWAPAADVLKLALGEWGAKGMSILVMLSALGAINGLIFTGARIYVGLGRDHRVFAWLGRWSARRGAPVWSLLAQGIITLMLILLVGTERGRNAVDVVVASVGLTVPWETYFGGFETLVAGSAPVFWVFFLLTGLSLFRLRELDRDIQRPFSVPWYPLLPVIFCTTCEYMLYSAVKYAGGLSLLGLVPLAIGIPLYLLSQAASRKPV